MHRHDYTGAQVVRMRRQLRAERAELLWLYKLLAVAIILCAVLTGTLLAVAQAAGSCKGEEGEGCLELPQKRFC